MSEELSEVVEAVVGIGRICSSKESASPFVDSVLGLSKFGCDEESVMAEVVVIVSVWIG